MPAFRFQALFQGFLEAQRLRLLRFLTCSAPQEETKENDELFLVGIQLLEEFEHGICLVFLVDAAISDLILTTVHAKLH